jgi:HK97 gp10 family phage protein
MARRKTTRAQREARKLRQALNRMDAGLTQSIRDHNREQAAEVFRDIESRIPVDSGDLKRSLRKFVAKDGLVFEVGWGKRWKKPFAVAGWRAHFVEFGTKQTRSKPMVRPAYQRLKRQSETHMTRQLETLLHRVKSTVERGGQ